ncbi:MAG TPA: dihydrofolate reductase family protein [Pyrinomonadaceae bacterium]|jgi:dihydrofolate reductase|nr:dihydrofolate reductase family protein [Pyrinomonadaceae bacterium]
MRKLLVFNSVTVDGYFTDKNNDMSWAHAQADAEWNEFVAGNAKSGGEMLFGRVTYQMMESFWPTPAAANAFPEVAEGMNKSPKIVFSKTLDQATWTNTRLLKGDLIEEVRKLKEESGDQLVLMGSGSIVAQLAPAGLIDEYQMVVNPLILGDGRTMFAGVKEKIRLTLTDSRTFKNGNVLLSYTS